MSEGQKKDCIIITEWTGFESAAMELGGLGIFITM
jgi:hypothetical protein